MRTIKFRAQDIASNKWLYGDIRHHKNDVCIFEQGGNRGEQVKPETVGQFTGFCDKDGHEIYEGDIVEVTDEDGTYRCLIEWMEDGFGGRPLDDDEPCCGLEMVFLQSFILKVIGNKVGNPELLTDGTGDD
jgi:hypothetical protein